MKRRHQTPEQIIPSSPSGRDLATHLGQLTVEQESDLRVGSWADVVAKLSQHVTELLVDQLQWPAATEPADEDFLRCLARSVPIGQTVRMLVVVGQHYRPPRGMPTVRDLAVAAGALLRCRVDVVHGTEVPPGSLVRAVLLGQREVVTDLRFAYAPYAWVLYPVGSFGIDYPEDRQPDGNTFDLDPERVDVTVQEIAEWLINPEPAVLTLAQRG